MDDLHLVLVTLSEELCHWGWLLGRNLPLWPAGWQESRPRHHLELPGSEGTTHTWVTLDLREKDVLAWPGRGRPRLLCSLCLWYTPLLGAVGTFYHFPATEIWKSSYLGSCESSSVIEPCLTATLNATSHTKCLTSSPHQRLLCSSSCQGSGNCILLVAQDKLLVFFVDSSPLHHKSCPLVNPIGSPSKIFPDSDHVSQLPRSPPWFKHPLSIARIITTAK